MTKCYFCKIEKKIMVEHLDMWSTETKPMTYIGARWLCRKCRNLMIKEHGEIKWDYIPPKRNSARKRRKSAGS